MKIDVLALKFSGFLINWREQAQISRRLSSEGAGDERGARDIVRVLGKLDASYVKLSISACVELESCFSFYEISLKKWLSL